MPHPEGCEHVPADSRRQPPRHYTTDAEDSKLEASLRLELALGLCNLWLQNHLLMLAGAKLIQPWQTPAVARGIIHSSPTPVKPGLPPVSCPAAFGFAPASSLLMTSGLAVCKPRTSMLRLGLLRDTVIQSLHLGSSQSSPSCRPEGCHGSKCVPMLSIMEPGLWQVMPWSCRNAFKINCS